MSIKVYPSSVSRPAVWCVLLLAGALCAVSVSCGGGGGDDGPNLPSSLTYSGVEDQAQITSANAQQIAGTALAGGQLGSNFGNIAEGMSTTSSAHGDNTAFHTYKIMESVLFRIDLSSRPYAIAAIVSESDIIPGFICGSEGGGNASYTVNLDTDTGDFSGSLAFNYYCQDNVELYGNTEFTGSADLTDPGEPRIVRFELNFGVLGIADYTLDEEGYIQGTFTYDGRATPVVLTMDLIIQEFEGLTYKINDYVWQVTDDDLDNTITIEIAGRFFHPSHGYVDIATGNPFVFWKGTLWPYEGDLVLQGKDNTDIQLSAIGFNECRITADTDGDGDRDDLDLTIFWDALII